VDYSDTESWTAAKPLPITYTSGDGKVCPTVCTLSKVSNFAKVSQVDGASYY